VSGKSGFRNLIAWQKADDLASAVFRAVRRLPASEGWLRDQMVRCAVSVAANIAEGHGRGTQGEFLRFIDISRGSLAELEYFIHFVSKEGLLAADLCATLHEKREETGRVLFGLWRSLKTLNKTEWDHTGRIREEAAYYQLN
jgi:four helix bundle protein